jgi:hypothetical protein
MIQVLFPHQPTPRALDLLKQYRSQVSHKRERGQYLLPLALTNPLYTIGFYHDVWSVVFQDGACETATLQNDFQVYSELWFTSPTPPVYAVLISIFRPGRLRKGSKRYLLIQVVPNVPHGSDILPYYENLAIVSDLRISMELACGECVPDRDKTYVWVVDRALVGLIGKKVADIILSTQINLTKEFTICGLILSFGENVFVSDKMSLQIFSLTLRSRKMW